MSRESVCIEVKWVLGKPVGVPCKYKTVCNKYTEGEHPTKQYATNRMKTCNRFKKYERRMSYYVITHDEGDDFSLWTINGGQTPTFKSEQDAIDYIIKNFDGYRHGRKILHKSFKADEGYKCVELFFDKIENGWFYRCAIVKCLIMDRESEE